ncbi:MAG: uracil-DNA glycosylase [Lachnospiraceae bacterium]|nr:uracil-DNA glycosylase [Lachnospiraceae bacterium]
MCLSDYKINNGWKDFFEQQKGQKYYKDLMNFVDDEYSKGTVFPAKENVFKAFELTDINDIKAVIIGQDPYHEINQAMGLAFSVPVDETIPPSLRNIYKEIEEEYGTNINKTGDLTDWAKQGVLLINSVLTVREGEANSHKDKGWEMFTDNVIRYTDKTNRPICYMLWGNYARGKKELINNSNSLILEAAHPSPLSASRGFFGCGHFKKCHDFVMENYNYDIKFFKKSEVL